MLGKGDGKGEKVWESYIPRRNGLLKPRKRGESRVNRNLLISIIVLVLAVVFGFGLSARMESPSGEVIARDVVAGGGGESTAPQGFVLNSTVAQTATEISAASNGTTLVGGFQVMVRRGPTAARHWQLY